MVRAHFVGFQYLNLPVIYPGFISFLKRMLYNTLANVLIWDHAFFLQLKCVIYSHHPLIAVYFSSELKSIPKKSLLLFRLRRRYGDQAFGDGSPRVLEDE